MRGDFQEFFKKATGFSPYEWQCRLASDGFTSVLPVPTGIGKTEGAALAWAWRLHGKMKEPRHLVYCLPMRTLVRQTYERLKRYFKNLAPQIEVEVYQLMGGASENEWACWPEKPWVLIGTQDQLLSRALNRGYAMSRFEWPVHFGLLNQDCRWIIDEVQLMGPGLWTTAQLDWMRQKRFASLAPCLSTWMSATVGSTFLATTDRKRDGLNTVSVFDPRLDRDASPELKRRLAANRPVKWFNQEKSNVPLEKRLAKEIVAKHKAGTLSLIVCNTVRMAQKVFRELPKSTPTILLTSRFRRVDREKHEQELLNFEARRKESGEPHIPGNPGLICVSTQVVEAGVDLSAHHLWSEVAPWGSVIQRLGRLNRDGRDPDPQAWFWTPEKRPGSSKEKRVGPYEEEDITRSEELLREFISISKKLPWRQAIAELGKTQRQKMEAALEPKLEPLPRALDVHGLFSTEPDVHGGFTDVSAFVRGVDPRPDLIVYWREWENGYKGVSPPLDGNFGGPPTEPEFEGCPVPFNELREMLNDREAYAWIWDEDADSWGRLKGRDLRPGMVVMVHREIGGYDVGLGWTGDAKDKPEPLPHMERAHALNDDPRTEIGHLVALNSHHGDSRAVAEELWDNLGLEEMNVFHPSIWTAVVEAAALHDLGKMHPIWQGSLPAAAALNGGPWAKGPHVFAVEVQTEYQGIHDCVGQIRKDAVFLGSRPQRRERKDLVRFEWAVAKKLETKDLESLRGLDSVCWAGHLPFRPGLRHEAATALALWARYKNGEAAYPALSVYLAAAHHGKIRTVLRSTTDSGEDVFGVPREPDGLVGLADAWPFDFSVAKDGAEGMWADGQFILTGHGWTGLVADLLGPWRAPADDRSEAGVVPEEEPRRLGPFVLAYLEALVRVADRRASKAPSKCFTPAEVSRGQ